ncbi:MAG: sigma-70 family RNA polymerase sigma factor [Verrucomicrobiales bacterium]|nr:sigma-70 family RNA polymerase sigma factor [Verrucomicrobiales bacterium]
MTDSQTLLAEYVRTGSETAFRELVTRYVDLVYSTALRLVVGDTHRAEDVTQVVFVDLARAARTLSSDVRLGGWLHRDTCFVAAKTMRGERRRQSRERQAVEMNALQDNSGTDLSLVAPILDEAINELGEADRMAVLLRFFEQHDFRSVGEALGSNEDAARMSVTRALDKLQGLLKRRGVTTSAATLSVVLSAHAVQIAPVGLAVTISTAAAFTGSTVFTTATSTAAKTIAMTTLQKTLIAAALVATVGTGIYEARQASTMRTQVQTLQQQQVLLAEQIERLTRERDNAIGQLATLRDDSKRVNGNTAELLKLRGEVSRLRSQELAQSKTGNSNDATDASAKSWVNRVSQLKQQLEQNPSAMIPELKFVTEQDWLDAAKEELNTEVDYRRALSALRSAGERKFASMLRKALKGYRQGNNGQLPTDLTQLQQHFDSPVDYAVLQRWEIAPASTIKSLVLGGDVIITQKTPVDDVFDARIAIGPDGGMGSTDFLNRDDPTIRSVWEAFRAANNGQWPTTNSQLLPYVSTPEQQLALQKLILRDSSRK